MISLIYRIPDKDVFCPDLLHTCRGNTNRSQSSSPAPTESHNRTVSDEQHYAEIDEIVQSVSQIRLRQHQQNVLEESAREFHSTTSNTQQSDNVPAPSGIPSSTQSRAQCVTAQIDPAQPVMGQSLSQRRPRLSLTWVLRNQNQAAATSTAASTTSNTICPSTAGTAVTIRTLEKKKLRSKSRDCTERMFSEKYVNGNADKTGNEYSVVAEPPDGVSKLFFVCSKKAANEYDSDDDEGCGLDRRSDRSRKSEKIKRASNNKLSFKNNLNNNNVNVEKTVNSDKLTSFKEVYATSEEPGQEDDKSCIKPADAALKATYSEPSLCKGDTGLSRRHRHRRRRERNRSQRFGYEIKNVDDFLSKVYML